MSTQWRGNSRGHQPDSSFLEQSSDVPFYMNSHNNLDRFLCSVYNYYQGKGFTCIVVARFLNLITLFWVIFLTTFLITFIDYEELVKTLYLPSAVRYTGYSSQSSSILINDVRVHPFLAACLFIFCIFWFYQLRNFLMDVKTYWGMKQFYNKELRISEDDIHTAEWNEVVQKLIRVPRLSNTKERMTHLDIANCIMRKENYLITMINKDILNLEIPFIPGASTSVVTKTLEWALSLTIFNYIFNSHGLQQSIISSSTYAGADGLRRRFRLMGLIGLIISPFLFVFLIVYLIFKYGEEMHSKPGTFALRQWSPLARWKFRELNELPHIFHRRLSASKPLAERYVTSFNVDILTILARFVSFMVGSIVVVLLLFGLYNEDMILKLELARNVSVFWLIGIATPLLAICRSLIPDPTQGAEPMKVMEDLVQHTHYMPKGWRGKTHTKKVLGEFTELFQYRFVVLATELLSVLITPLVLLFSLPKSSEDIILFFKEYTFNWPGVGDVCKFAVFPLQEHGSKTYGAESNSSKRNRTKQGKMEKSFLNFKANNPEWQPGEEGEKYIAHVSAAMENSMQFSKNFLGSSVKSEPLPDHLEWSSGMFGSTGGMSTLSDSISSLQRFHRVNYLHPLKPSSFNEDFKESVESIKLVGFDLLNKERHMCFTGVYYSRPKEKPRRTVELLSLLWRARDRGRYRQTHQQLSLFCAGASASARRLYRAGGTAQSQASDVCSDLSVSFSSERSSTMKVCESESRMKDMARRPRIPLSSTQMREAQPTHEDPNTVSDLQRFFIHLTAFAFVAADEVIATYYASDCQTPQYIIAVSLDVCIPNSVNLHNPSPTTIDFS
ncbi:autophagy protein 9 [Planoprotostelium fungivorum]|uniref:Autophagy-related protein 9 n=1 Tax=Planoprotostelium fungivorum TaxID=1890364 RepID=A0A2P6NSA4_9EUKA|nr:autophagy protein 9 [Planoprotostelium fungivorum]